MIRHSVAKALYLAGGRGNEGGERRAARELNIERTQDQRAVKVASLTDEAKEAARAAGIEDNQSALLAAAAGRGIISL